MVPARQFAFLALIGFMICFLPATLADASNCTATDEPNDDGRDGKFYCESATGTVRGMTGACACDCVDGYEGPGCSTATNCTASDDLNDDGSDGKFYCTAKAVLHKYDGVLVGYHKEPLVNTPFTYSGNVGGATGNCTCACADGYEGPGCATASKCVATEFPFMKTNGNPVCPTKYVVCFL